ncbi:MAG: hypothetical protein ACKOPO_09885 [Novosphingobium sp.]
MGRRRLAPAAIAIAIACALAGGSGSAASGQSVFDRLARSEVTEHWLILSGMDGCGATHRPADGNAMINGQPSYDVKRSGGRVLSFGPKQVGEIPHDKGIYTVIMAATRIDVPGQPWRDGAPGLRLDMPARFSAMLAGGGDITVIKGNRPVLEYRFEADGRLVEELRRCLGGWLPQN